MYSSRENEKGAMNFSLSWQFLFIKVLALALALALVSIYVTKPTGTLAGRVAIEQEDVHLFSYALGEHSVTALVTGPRGNSSDERAVRIKPNGTFRV
jgi:hypothetical protein